MNDAIRNALRLAREMGGPAEEGTVERKPWSPFRGLKITPPPEKLSSEPDIREYQQKRHAFEFEGGAEPEAPKRKVVVDAPLLGGKKELGELPYDYAGMANTVLNTLYGLKTAPLYASPYTAPVGRALDAYETVKKVGEDPSAFSSYTALPKLVRGAGPIGAVGAGAGAVMATDKDEEEPMEKAFGGAAFGDQVNSLDAVYNPKKSPLDITNGTHTPALNTGGLPSDEQIINALGLARSKMSNGGQPGAKTPEQEEAERQAAVTAAYNTYLGRAPEATGQAYWLNQLQSGAIAAPDLSQQFQQSAEGQVYASDLGRAFETAYGRAPREATEAMNWARAYREANPITYTVGDRFMPSAPLPNWNPNIPTSNVNTPPLNPTLTQTNPLQPFNPNVPISGLPTPGIGSNVVIPGTTTGAGTGTATPGISGSPVTPDNRTELPAFNPNIPVSDIRTPGMGDNVVVPGTTTGAGTGTATPGAGGSPVTPDNRNEIPVWNPNIGRSDMATPPIAPPLEQLRSNQVTVNPQDYSSFVTSLYNTYTGRAPDVEGQTFFMNALQQGSSPADVAQVFASSPEAQMNQVGSMYQYVLGRQADAEGLNYFKDQIAQGRMDLADVAETMMQSPEYQDYMNQQFEAAQNGINEVNPFDFAATALQTVGERGPMPDGYRDPNVWGQSETPDLFPTSFASTLLNKGLGADQQLRPGYVDPNVMLASRDNAVNKFQFAVEALEGGLGENGVYQPYVDASINAQKVNDAIAKFNPDNPNSFASGVFRSLANREPTVEELASLSMMNDPLAKGLLSPKEAASEIGKMVSAPLPPARPSDAELKNLEQQNLNPPVNRNIFDIAKDVLKGVVQKANEGFKRLTGIGKNPELDYQRRVAIEREADELGVDPADLAAAMLFESIGSLNPNRKGMPDNRKGSAAAIKKGAVPRFMGLIQFGAQEQLDYGVKPNMSFDEQMVAVGKFLKARGLSDWIKKHPDATREEKLAALYSTINAGSPGKENWGKTDKAAGGKPTTVWQKSRELAQTYGDRAKEILGTSAPTGYPTAEDTQKEKEQEQEQEQEQESVTPPPSTGGGQIPNMGGDSGFVPGGGGTSGAGDISGAGGDHTGGHGGGGTGHHAGHGGGHTGGHTTTPHTPGGVHSIHGGGGSHLPSHGHGSVEFAPVDFGSHAIHSPNFGDYASSHGFGHSTVGHNSHFGHHGGHHGSHVGPYHGWSWDMFHSQNPYGILHSFKDGGVVEDALRIAHKRLKGGKINTKIDTDPDWDMKLASGGRR